MKRVVATLSAINGVLGVLLLARFFGSEDTPLVMLAFGIAMLIQAGYTLLYLTGLLGSFEPWSLRALLVDDTAGAQAEPAG